MPDDYLSDLAKQVDNMVKYAEELECELALCRPTKKPRYTMQVAAFLQEISEIPEYMEYKGEDYQYALKLDTIIKRAKNIINP